MKKFKQINRQRKNRAFRVSNAVKRYSSRPRLCVFRSNTNVYAQIIDDNLAKTLVAASTRDKDIRSEIPNGGNCTAAEKIGGLIAKKALAAGIKQVAFDRHGFKYHGRIKALADAARHAGLDIGAEGEAKVPKESSKKDKAQSGSNKKVKPTKETKNAAKAAAGKANAKKK
ncbi:MAG: 50S ribosomal protein L18 [Planctomycetaceae bacterium]|jgi:large subunit ribosomal protein L18|nr:50S ribosomal protein L18 [Planctomycetaceae bacterium]